MTNKGDVKKLKNGLEYYDSVQDWKHSTKRPKIILLTIIFTIIIIGSLFVYSKYNHKKEMQPLIATQESLIHQMLVDLLQNYSVSYEIEPFSTSINNDDSLTTNYTVKIEDKEFSDNIHVKPSGTMTADDMFTEANKNTFYDIIDYAAQVTQEKAWNDLEERMVSMSIELIKSQLAYPDNADFGGAKLEKVSDNKDGTGYYRVKGKVTAINGYGAKIKYNYVVSINISDDYKKYNVADFNIF